MNQARPLHVYLRDRQERRWAEAVVGAAISSGLLGFILGALVS